MAIGKLTTPRCTSKTRCKQLFMVSMALSLLLCVLLHKQFFDVRTKEKKREVNCILPSAEKVNQSVNVTRLREIVQNRRKTRIGNSKFLIVIYTTQFFRNVWEGVGYALLPDYMKRKKCKYRNCLVTYDKDSLITADAVLFHGVDLQATDQFSGECLHQISKFRPSHQRWIYYMHESPEYTGGLVPYDGLFNWTMTYMRDSDIFMPYFHYQPLNAREVRPNPSHNYAHGKDGLVLWIVSHCGLLRDEYVKELEKYVDVTVYGRCGSMYKHNGGSCSQWVSQCDRHIGRFKFYLAFENCFCEDYVTEKYWDKGLLHGTVPIVMGAIYHPDLVVPGSYIDVNDFGSIKELADHILYLDSNDNEYNRYFKWRQKYKVIRGYDFLCQTCKALNENEGGPPNTYHQLSKYWNTQHRCKKYEGRVRKLHEHIGFSRYG